MQRYSYSLCWACALGLWDLHATTFAVTGNTSRSCSHPHFVFSSPTPSPQLCHPLWNCVWLKERAGLKPSVPRRKDGQTTQCMGPRPSKGSPEQRRRVVPILSPLLSDRGCQPKQGKLNCSLKAAAYNPVNYYYPKYPHLKMIMLQRDFPECFHLASRCHTFPTGGRTGSQCIQGEHYKALSTES